MLILSPRIRTQLRRTLTFFVADHHRDNTKINFKFITTTTSQRIKTIEQLSSVCSVRTGAYDQLAHCL